MYFGLLNPNLLWRKRFDSRVSEITSKKLSKSRVSVENLEKKKKHCFHHIKNILFYVFWLAESKFLMEKEVWQPSFGDNLKNCWKAVFLWKNLRRKKNIVSITLKTLYFYVFWLDESKFVMEKEVWSPSFGDNLKKLSKSHASVEKLKKKKNIVSITLKTLYFKYFGLLNPNFLWKKKFGSLVSEITSKTIEKPCFCGRIWEEKKTLIRSH